MHGPNDSAAARAPLSHADKRSIVLAVLLPMFLGALDITIVATALASIATGLNDFANISWVVTIALLSATVATPLYGKLSDIHGRRKMMLISIGVYLVGSLGCALAPNLLVLVIARAVQGLGSGGSLPLSQIIIAESTTPVERPRYQGYTSTMFMVATVAGPVLGGFLSEYVDWRAIFWINIPLGLAAFITSYLALRRLPRHDRPHDLDLTGALLMVCAGLSLMLALTWASKQMGWFAPQTLALFGASAALWALFAWRMMRAPEPFVSLAVLANRTVFTSTGCSFFGVGTVIGLTILVPLYLQLAHGLSGSISGLAVIALQSGVTISSIISTWIIVRIRHYMRVPLVLACVAIAGLMILVWEPVAWPLWFILTVLTVVGIGLGPLFPMTVITIQNVIPPRQMGIATGVAGFFRTLGGTFLVAVFGAILLSGAQADGIVTDPHVFRLMFLAAVASTALATLFLLGIEERPWRTEDIVPD